MKILNYHDVVGANGCRFPEYFSGSTFQEKEKRGNKKNLPKNLSRALNPLKVLQKAAKSRKGYSQYTETPPTEIFILK